MLHIADELSIVEIILTAMQWTFAIRYDQENLAGTGTQLRHTMSNKCSTCLLKYIKSTEVSGLILLNLQQYLGYIQTNACPIIIIWTQWTLIIRARLLVHPVYFTT